MREEKDGRRSATDSVEDDVWRRAFAKEKLISPKQTERNSSLFAGDDRSWTGKPCGTPFRYDETLSFQSRRTIHAFDVTERARHTQCVLYVFISSVSQSVSGSLHPGAFHRSFRDQSHVTEIVSEGDRYTYVSEAEALGASRHRSSRNRATSEFQVRAYIAIGYHELPGALTGTRRGNLTLITL